MEISIRHMEPVERESIRIKIHGNEYLLTEKADGLQIVEITDDVITVRPQTANSMVILTKNNI